jgi:hypothetical protein
MSSKELNEGASALGNIMASPKNIVLSKVKLRAEVNLKARFSASLHHHHPFAQTKSPAPGSGQ